MIYKPDNGGAVTTKRINETVVIDRPCVITVVKTQRGRVTLLIRDAAPALPYREPRTA